jgi:hypothetical protein
MKCKALSIVRKAFSIVCLTFAVACLVLQAGELHLSYPSFFLHAAAFAAIPILTGGRVLRIIAVVLLLIAIVGAIGKVQQLADAKVSREQFTKFVTAARNLHGKIREYGLTHPFESFSSLDDYVSHGVLAPEDVAFLHDAEVACYPVLPNGADNDTLIEVWQGRRRTLISQDGGVFGYDASKITYLGGSPKPSKEFVGAVNRRYPGAIPTPTPSKK